MSIRYAERLAEADIATVGSGASGIPITDNALAKSVMAIRPPRVSRREVVLPGLAFQPDVRWIPRSGSVFRCRRLRRLGRSSSQTASSSHGGVCSGPGSDARRAASPLWTPSRGRRGARTHRGCLHRPLGGSRLALRLGPGSPCRLRPFRGAGPAVGARRPTSRPLLSGSVCAAW